MEARLAMGDRRQEPCTGEESHIYLPGEGGHNQKVSLSCVLEDARRGMFSWWFT